MVTRIGIVSDIHENPEGLGRALETITNRGVDLIVANGDIGNDRKTIEYSMESLAKTDLPVFVSPGSHESYDDFSLSAEKLKRRFGNLVDVTEPENQKIEGRDFALVFLPGSDVLGHGGNYKITAIDPEEFPTGTYVDLGEEMQEFSGADNYLRARQEGLDPMSYHNMFDLQRLVTDPKHTTLFCHVPIKFQNKSNGVDYANSIVLYAPSKKVDGQLEERGIRAIPESERNRNDDRFVSYEEYSGDEDKLFEIVREKYDRHHEEIQVEVKGNRGNKKLREIVEWLGIDKMITAHFHGAVHKQHDLSGRPIEEGTYVPKIFANASCIDRERAGIYHIDGTGLVKIENIQN